MMRTFFISSSVFVSFFPRCYNIKIDWETIEEVQLEVQLQFLLNLTLFLLNFKQSWRILYEKVNKTKNVMYVVRLFWKE